MEREQLFISYASEDIRIATWLANKLIARGYSVWFDQDNLLGGEQWAKVIGEAIENKTFRMLALFSASSTNKKRPQGERLKAEEIGKRDGIDDFLIPLHIDDSKLDWLTDPTQCIPFNRGLAEGWRRLIKKLEDINTPRPNNSLATLPRDPYPSSSGLVTLTPEKLAANVLEVKVFPEKLLLFAPKPPLKATQLEALAEVWPFSQSGVDLISIVSTSVYDLEYVEDECEWPNTDRWQNRPARDIAAELLLKSISIKGIERGWIPLAQKQSYYITEGYTSDGWIRFPDIDRKERKLKIKGKATFTTPREKEFNSHFLSFSLRLARGLDKNLYLQVRPRIALFDSAGEPLDGSKVNSRRKRLTKFWYNEKWRLRLFAAFQLLRDLDLREFGIELSNSPMLVQSPASINEELLEPTTDEGDEGTYELTDEDLKGSYDDDLQS